MAKENTEIESKQRKKKKRERVNINHIYPLHYQYKKRRKGSVLSAISKEKTPFYSNLILYFSLSAFYLFFFFTASFFLGELLNLGIDGPMQDWLVVLYQMNNRKLTEQFRIFC